MEPVPVTSRVRRTVRVAVALVVGQALLGTLIGWLTLSQSRPAENRAGTSAVDQLAAPPVAAGPPVLGTASVATPASSALSRAPSQRPRRTAAAEPPAPPAPSLPPASPTPTPSPGLILLPPPVPPATSSAVPPAPPAASPSASPSPSGRVREPVTVGDRCWPEGAFGRTADGALVRCEADRHRRPRWKIV